MTNAREEFEEHVLGRVVKCAVVKYYSVEPELRLHVSYTEKQYEEFLSKLNFKYDDGYGSQELDGVIWYTDGSWSTRGEYDGSEWWELNILPEVPEKLKGETKWASSQVPVLLYIA